MKAAVCNRRHGCASLNGDGFDAVHSCGFDQGGAAAPSNVAFVVSAERCILAVQGHDFVIMNRPRR